VILYVVAITVHVLCAVLAIGLVGAVPLTARFARRSTGDLAGTQRILGALLRAMQVGFVVMLLTGGLIDFSAGGTFHRTGWFRASIAVLVAIGASHARARAALRRAFAPGGQPATALVRVERWGWAMCVGVALMTILMQMKPLP
jgi:hypothetical protein